MEYVDAYLVVCANIMTSVSNKFQEVEMTAGIYCPHGAFLKKSEAAEYAKSRPENTLIVPCMIPKVVE